MPVDAVVIDVPFPDHDELRVLVGDFIAQIERDERFTVVRSEDLDQLKLHLERSLDLAEAVRQTKRDTWRFAKRQLNWFSSDPSIQWFKRRDQVDPDEVQQALRALQVSKT